MTSFGLNVFFGKAKINYIYKSFFVFAADHKVVGLDVAMQKSFLLDSLKPEDNLNSNVQNSSEAEFFLTE